MICVCSTEHESGAAQFVAAALQRSGLSCLMRRGLSDSERFDNDLSAEIIFTINPTRATAKHLIDWFNQGRRKLAIFGAVPDSLLSFLDLQTTVWSKRFPDCFRASSAPAHAFSESSCCIVYATKVTSKLGFCISQRAAERFDFADEWNNLGYGSIKADGSAWSVAAPLRADRSDELARFEVDGTAIATYASLHDQPSSSVLWFNRPVGPIDSFEWRLVEQFIANYRHEDLPCQPIISELPHGHDAAVTMRLDCDEDVESSRALFDAYRKMDVPFSLAVHTALLSEEANRPILGDVLRSGGSILSHSATHAPNWGGSYEAAYREATESKQALESLTGATIRYAVSPFHQTPSYALEALRDAGYAGCIGGIIRNDPEFLLARGGTLADLEGPFIGHSQQHMLHGDCLLSDGDPLAVSKQAFDLAMASKTLFGYLDHPFSARYQYGWSDESSRIAAHRELVGYIRSVAKKPLFLSEDRALDFISRKAAARLVQDGDRFRLEEEDVDKAVDFDFSAEYRGKVYNVSREEIPV
jgi:hypothetical protein